MSDEWWMTVTFLMAFFMISVLAWDARQLRNRVRALRREFETFASNTWQFDSRIRELEEAYRRLR